MRKYIFTLFLSLLLFSNGKFLGQTRTWSTEISITFPIVGIYMVQVSCPVSNYGNLLFGLCFQNWKDQGEAKGVAHAYTLLFGYRQFVGDKLNFEVTLFPAYNNFVSSIDNKVYSGFETWIEYRVGYKFNFNDKFYINPQPGLGHALYLENIWPGMSRETYIKNSIMFVPQVTIGIH